MSDSSLRASAFLMIKEERRTFCWLAQREAT
jgi:hypothetical protein